MGAGSGERLTLTIADKLRDSIHRGRPGRLDTENYGSTGAVPMGDGVGV